MTETNILKPFTPEWKAAGVLVETDTDGLIVDKKPNIDRINEFMTEIVKNNFDIDDCTLVMEEERFERGFIHRMKNYMLIELDRKGKPKEVLHGAYFKSSRTSKVYDDAVRCIVDWALYDKISEVEARAKASDIRLRPIEDFVMRVKLSKNIKDYVTTKDEFYDDNDTKKFNPITSEVVYTSDFSISSNQVVALAMQYKNITGQIPEKGTMIPYLTVADPLTGRKKYEYFNLRDETLKERINYEMYEKQINKLFEETNVASFNKVKKEEDWLEEFL